MNTLPQQKYNSQRLIQIIIVLHISFVVGAQTIYSQPDYWHEKKFPPVLLNDPPTILQLQDTIDIPEKWKYGAGKLFIDREGNIDSVLCYAPVHQTEKLEAFCSVAKFRAGVLFDGFANMELDFRLRFLDFLPTSNVELFFLESKTETLEDGTEIRKPLYEEHDYNIAYRNAIFKRDFPKKLESLIEYVDFNILVDTISKINRSGKYYIPDRKGYTLTVHGNNNEQFLLINVRRNCQIMLTDLILNLEKDDDYLLVCQKNSGYKSTFYFEYFKLTSNHSINPSYQDYTHNQLRDQITTKWGKRWQGMQSGK